jgi:hypothetical protein
VRIDETGHEHPSAAIDALCIWTRALELVRRSHSGNAVPYDEHPDAAAHLRIAHLGATTRARRAGAGDNLGCVQEEKAHRWETAKMTEYRIQISEFSMLILYSEICILYSVIFAVDSRDHITNP